jgi:hypothetical protein
MKIGIGGNKATVAKWLPLLKPHLNGVDFVDDETTGVDAVIFCYVDMEELEQSRDSFIRSRINVCAIGDLPTDAARVERWFHLAEEAGIRIQWSNWASYSAPVQYMYGKIIILISYFEV